LDVLDSPQSLNSGQNLDSAHVSVLAQKDRAEEVRDASLALARGSDLKRHRGGLLHFIPFHPISSGPQRRFHYLFDDLFQFLATRKFSFPLTWIHHAEVK
jgi:hypothetical protein